MILVYIESIKDATFLLQSAVSLAKSLKKDMGVIKLIEPRQQVSLLVEEEIAQVVEKENITNVKIFVKQKELSDLTDICEELEASFLLIQLNGNSSKLIQKYLNACRALRIPYLFFKETFSTLDIKKVLVPVSFLEEEYEKAQFASAFGRFYGAEITLLLANDSGSKAKITADKMEQLFNKFSLNCVRRKAVKDSFKIEKESIQIGEREDFDIILISASRDYGLDDLLFGPKERYIVKTSGKPVLLINPRGDLYALCD